MRKIYANENEHRRLLHLSPKVAKIRRLWSSGLHRGKSKAALLVVDVTSSRLIQNWVLVHEHGWTQQLIRVNAELSLGLLSWQ